MSLLQQLECAHESDGFSAFQAVAGAGPEREVFICSRCKARRIKRRGVRPTHSLVQIVVDTIALLAGIALLPITLPAVGI